MAYKKAPRQRGSSALPAPLLLLGGAVVLGLIAIALFVTGGAEPSGGRGPQLAVNRERIDFGKVPFDKMVRAEFRIENTGDRTLTLDATTPIRVLEGC